jgi:hypothetical protein
LDFGFKCSGMAELGALVDGYAQSRSLGDDREVGARLGEGQAQRAGEVVRWASQHLNLEIGLALRSDRWIGADYWEQAADRTLTLDELLSRSEVVVMGVDGGGHDHLLGLAVLGRDEKTRQWLLWSKAWAHTSVLERRKSEASILNDFEEAGDLVICQRLGDDIAEIAELRSPNWQSTSTRRDYSTLWRSNVLGGSQRARRAEGQCDTRDQASIGIGQDRSADGGVQRHCADVD